MAQGETGAVESLEEWLHRGPELARVDGVEVREVSVDPGLGPFCVR
jgi:acylphosphatase